MFRFISVFYGSLLEPFLAAGGKELEQKSAWEKDLIVKNEVSTRRKINFYNKGISTVDSFHYKIILYFVSYLVRLAEKAIILILRKKRRIPKFLFYFIYVHNRVHFVLVNMFLAGGVFLNLRTLLHMKSFPELWYLKVDKIMAIFCFFFYWSDICEMYGTARI